jgi:hypothetical protein
MDRNITGSMTIGGRGANRNFHGKVASFVTTTLRRNFAMPGDAEIERMITDPVRWLNDDKIGNPYRIAWDNYNNASFSLNDTGSRASTQIWLMGDGNYGLILQHDPKHRFRYGPELHQAEPDQHG